MEAGRFEVRLGDLKKEWIAHCESKGVNASAAIKVLIAREMAGEAAARIYSVEPVSETKKRVEVKLTSSEREAADARSKLEGFSSTNVWIAAAVRSALTNMPQFGHREIEVLGQSNHELLAIGRNLNQIAKHLNSLNGDPVAYDRRLVEDLSSAVKRHVSKVGDVLRASIYRWKLK